MSIYYNLHVLGYFRFFLLQNSTPNYEICTDTGIDTDTECDDDDLCFTATFVHKVG